MQNPLRQNSFSREKTQIITNKQDPPNTHKYKNNTNPPTHEQQISKELVRKSEGEQNYLPVYRVTKSKFEKNNFRYSDNSPLKSKEKVLRMSPYKQQEFQAYNFGHMGPFEQFERKKKGRSYFYKRNEEKKQDTDPEGHKINNNNSNNDLSRPPPIEVVQLVKTTEAKEKEAELTLEEMHYQMVKTYQKCKQNSNF